MLHLIQRVDVPTSKKAVPVSIVEVITIFLRLSSEVNLV